LIAKLKDRGRLQVPVTDLSELTTESDVEQKLVYPSRDTAPSRKNPRRVPGPTFRSAIAVMVGVAGFHS
jgi:hypothetical protein